MNLDQWEAKAGEWARGTVEKLWGSSGDVARAMLRKGQLKEAVLRGAELGFNPRDQWVSRASWGLDPLFKDDGTPKKLWLPAGIVIPVTEEGKLQKLRVWAFAKREGFFTIDGSQAVPFWATPRRAQQPVVVVDNELQALRVGQESGPMIGAMALAGQLGSRGLADRVREDLRDAEGIVVALGAGEASVRLRKMFPSAQGLPYPGQGEPFAAWMSCALGMVGWVDNTPCPPEETARWEALAASGKTDMEVTDLEEAIFLYALRSIERSFAWEDTWAEGRRYWMARVPKAAFACLEQAVERRRHPLPDDLGHRQLTFTAEPECLAPGA